MDRDNISDAAIRQMRKVLDKPEATPRAMTQQSKAAGPLCQWVAALEKYHVAMQTVRPMQAAVAGAEAGVQQGTEQLEASKLKSQVLLLHAIRSPNLNDAPSVWLQPQAFGQ